MNTFGLNLFGGGYLQWIGPYADLDAQAFVLDVDVEDSDVDLDLTDEMLSALAEAGTLDTDVIDAPIDIDISCITTVILDPYIFDDGEVYTFDDGVIYEWS